MPCISLRLTARTFFFQKVVRQEGKAGLNMLDRVLFSCPVWLTCCRYESDIMIWKHININTNNPKYQLPAREIRNTIIIINWSSAFLLYRITHNFLKLKDDGNCQYVQF